MSKQPWDLQHPDACCSKSCCEAAKDSAKAEAEEASETVSRMSNKDPHKPRKTEIRDKKIAAWNDHRDNLHQNCTAAVAGLKTEKDADEKGDRSAIEKWLNKTP